MKVARFDMAKAVDTDTALIRAGPGRMAARQTFPGGQQREPLELGVLETHNSSLILLDFFHKVCSWKKTFKEKISTLSGD
jgi:hypothetical protein